VKENILIVGDSFSVSHSNPSINNYGWSFLLEKNYNITNLSKCGVSEYKILQQLKSTKLDKFNCIIVSHTSPNRVYVDQHPIHDINNMYSEADLIYNDVLWNLKEHPNNVGLAAANYYFDHFYNQDYQELIYRLLQKEITEITKNKLSLHLLTLFDKNIDLFQNSINLYQKIKIDPGNINHYSAKDNQYIFNIINSWIKQNV